MILYLLIFQEGTHFKVGHSDHQHNRIESLQKTYEDFGKIDYTQSLQVVGSEDEILKLENQLKFDYCKHFRHDRRRDGWTETCSMEYLSRVLHDVEVKVSMEWKGLKLEPLQQIPEKEPRQRTAKTRGKKKERIPTYEERFNILDFFKHPYGQRIIELTQPGQTEIRLSASDMPGIFTFVHHLQREQPQLTKSQRHKELTTGSIIRGPIYFPQVAYAFHQEGPQKHEPDYVKLYPSESFFEYLATGELQEMMNEYVPVNGMLLDVQKLTKHEYLDNELGQYPGDGGFYESEVDAFFASMFGGVHPVYPDRYQSKI